MKLDETKMLLNCLDKGYIELAKLYLKSNIEKKYINTAKKAYNEYIHNCNDLVSGYLNNKYIFSNYSSIYILNSDKILSDYVKKVNREYLFDDKEELINKLHDLNNCLINVENHAIDVIDSFVINNDNVKLYSKQNVSIVDYNEYLYLNQILDEDVKLYITSANNYCYAKSSRGKALVLTKKEK